MIRGVRALSGRMGAICADHGILFNGYMMVKLGWLNWVRLIVWLVIGLVIYFCYGAKNSRVQNGELPGELTED